MDAEMEGEPKIGRITVAPEVLETIARLTTLAVPGVARLQSSAGVGRLLRQGGVRIEMVGSSAAIELHVVTEPDINLLRIGHQIQAEVTRAIQDLVGMEVHSVDVYVEDVGSPPEKA